mmetsp:Transcript_29735/g.74657  ORF Transcript_29735/g.74657 Transcript_29735/m.74657 type:complete len:269 (+) Transcript_29735:251-1057(+)
MHAAAAGGGADGAHGTAARRQRRSGAAPPGAEASAATCRCGPRRTVAGSAACRGAPRARGLRSAAGCTRLRGSLAGWRGACQPCGPPAPTTPPRDWQGRASVSAAPPPPSSRATTVRGRAPPTLSVPHAGRSPRCPYGPGRDLRRRRRYAQLCSPKETPCAMVCSGKSPLLLAAAAPPFASPSLGSAALARADTAAAPPICAPPRDALPKLADSLNRASAPWRRECGVRTRPRCARCAVGQLAGSRETKRAQQMQTRFPTPSAECPVD